jgi:purine-nucleoside phosphorylase
LAIARQHAFAACPGVYVALTGPNYETRAEYRFLRRIGGDAVGMSTVPEVVTAAHLGMRVLALSTITNVAKPDAPRTIDPQEVVDQAAGAEPKLSKIVAGIVERFARLRSTGSGRRG